MKSKVRLQKKYKIHEIIFAPLCIIIHPRKNLLHLVSYILLAQIIEIPSYIYLISIPSQMCSKSRLNVRLKLGSSLLKMLFCLSFKHTEEKPWERI